MKRFPDRGTTSWIDAARAGRHAIREFEDGAAAIDVDSGELLQLNRTGAFIYAHLVRGTAVHEVAELMSARFGIGKQQALADVTSFLALRPTAALQEALDHPSPFEYVAADGFFAVCRAAAPATPILYIHPSGQWVTSVGDRPPVTRAALVWVVPKILTLLGLPVLHASAVSIAGRIVAFSGRSGAGKTTLARAFANAGGTLLAVDGVAVQLGGGVRDVRLTPIEERARVWVDRALSDSLKSGGRIETNSLLELNGDSALPLTDVMFLDSKRREGQRLHKVRLGQTAGAVGLLQNLFWASTNSEGYERALEWSAAIGREVSVSELTVPAGIPQLLSATRDYAENTAS